MFIAIDAYLKWPKVLFVSYTAIQQTIDKLRTNFATHGLPATLAYDNSPPFTSVEFEKFRKANGITHRCIPPYHLSSNDLVKNMVNTVKQALSKCKILANATLETHITLFLASYCNKRHTTTSRTPAELLLC